MYCQTKFVSESDKKRKLVAVNWTATDFSELGLKECILEHQPIMLVLKTPTLGVLESENGERVARELEIHLSPIEARLLGAKLSELGFNHGKKS